MALKRMLKILVVVVTGRGGHRAGWSPGVVDHVELPEPEGEPSGQEGGDTPAGGPRLEAGAHLICSRPRLRMCLKENPLMSAITVTPAICVFT